MLTIEELKKNLRQDIDYALDWILRLGKDDHVGLVSNLVTIVLDPKTELFVRMNAAECLPTVATNDPESLTRLAMFAADAYQHPGLRAAALAACASLEARTK